MELICEILFEVYLELMMLIVPEKKATSKKYRIIAVTIAIIALLGNLALLVWGGVLVFEKQNLLGIIPLVIAIVWSLAQIILGFVLQSRKDK